MQPNRSVPLQVPVQDEEALSALFDGEVPDPEGQALIQRLGRDEGWRMRWAEYSLIGDVLRGAPAGGGAARSRLRAALEREPTLLAPVRKPIRSHPLLWLSAVATVAAVTWMVLGAAPTHEVSAEIASRPADSHVMTYLAAHQDYAQAVTAKTELRLMPVSLASAEVRR